MNRAFRWLLIVIGMVALAWVLGFLLILLSSPTNSQAAGRDRLLVKCAHQHQLHHYRRARHLCRRAKHPFKASERRTHRATSHKAGKLAQERTAKGCVTNQVATAKTYVRAYYRVDPFGGHLPAVNLNAFSESGHIDFGWGQCGGHKQITLAGYFKCCNPDTLWFSSIYGFGFAGVVHSDRRWHNHHRALTVTKVGRFHGCLRVPPIPVCAPKDIDVPISVTLHVGGGLS